MKISFLGTGAGEGYPSPWCECPNCSHARQRGGKNIRGYSSLMIDNDILIDLTESTCLTAAHHGISLANVRHLFVTHAHSDHFAPNQLWARFFPSELTGLSLEEMVNSHGAPRITPLDLLRIYGNPCICEAIEQASELAEENEAYSFAFHGIEAGQTLEIGETQVLVLDSLHVYKGFTQNYIITRGGKRLLYALDSGGHDADTMKLIASFRYDMIVLEGTSGLMKNDGNSHMSIEKAKAFFQQMKSCDAADDGTLLYLSHDRLSGVVGG